MAISRNKVAIIGVGNVGAALAHHLTINSICDDLVLINRNRQKAWAEVMDLSHALGFSPSSMRISDGTYEDAADADIVVLAISAPTPGAVSRLDMLEASAKAVSAIVSDVMKAGFNGIFLVVTNPVDPLAYLTQKISGLPAARVIGTGTSLDSARLRHYLAKLMGVDPRSMEAFCIGEHGDSQIIPWSQITVGGKKFSEILTDWKTRFEGVNLEGVRSEIAEIGYRVVQGKGSTSYGIASMAAQIIRAILRDENKVMPVSAMFQGEYGETDVYAGIPAVLGMSGVKELVEYHLTEDEAAGFARSIKILREANRKALEWA